MAMLANDEGISALALRFTILTAARTGEVIGARWSEIDMPAGVLWIVPGGADESRARAPAFRLWMTPPWPSYRRLRPSVTMRRADGCSRARVLAGRFPI